MKPSSFCTVATKACQHELVGLLLSIAVHHPKSKVYVLCDTSTEVFIKKITPQPKITIKWFAELDNYTNLNRQLMEQQGIFLNFLMSKIDIMKKALKYEKNTLFLDSDIVLFSPITDINRNKKIGVSKQYLVKQSLIETGYYNAGMLWTNSIEVCNDWKKFSRTSRYFEQAAIEDLVNKYSHFEFGEESNVQSWRCYFNNEKVNFETYFAIDSNSKIYYKNKELVCIHTHFRDKRFRLFNNLIMKFLCKAKRYKELLIISRIINDNWVIRIPSNQHLCSFRELAPLMSENTHDLSIIKTKDKHCWLSPNILLYDRPTTEWCDNEVNNASLFLLGNGNVNIEGNIVYEKTGVNIKPWIFWPRYPRIVEETMKLYKPLRYSERKNNCVFIGNMENKIQQLHRQKFIEQWSESIDLFICTLGKKQLYTPIEYLEKLRNSRYGLCIRGYGSKCHREMELMAFGTVPIVTEGVNTSSFLEPLIENKHYFKVSSPAQLKKIVMTTHKEKWRLMSIACHEWYMRNIHSHNAWSNMIHHILFSC